MIFRKQFIAILIFLSTLFWGCDGNMSETSAFRNSLLGKWNVVEFNNNNFPNSSVKAPNGEIIEINFTSNGRLSGTTPGNTFNGEYRISNEVLSIIELVSTETADTEYGQLFYKSLNNSRDATTSSSIFQIENFQSNSLQLNYGIGKHLLLERP